MPQFGFWLPLPLVALQALRVRKHALRLAEADGPRSGRSSDDAKLDLLCLGDSIMAGVGCSSIDQAFAGSLVRGLHVRGIACNWRSAARSGLRAEQLIALLDEIDGNVDLVVISVGVNDATALRTRAKFTRDLRALLAALKHRWPHAVCAHLGLPPMQRFPALPQPLRHLSGLRAAELDRVAARCASQMGHLHLPMGVEVNADDFAVDGFHPNEAACARWADHIAAELAQRPELARWRR